MSFKLLAFTCFLAAAHAGVIAPFSQYAAPVAHYAAPAAHYSPHHEDYAPAEYSFEYSVHDEHTGDIKSQKEVRHGDQVQGSYSLVEPDGTLRVVEYNADGHSGFNAVVHREPSQHAPAYKPVVKIAAPIGHYGAPAYQGYAHAAPAHSYYHH